jgi:hypothetical protein
LQDQKQLYYCHIFNILFFSLTWVPYVTLHFLSFAIQLDLTDNYGLRTFFLSLIALTPTLNTVTRVLFDPSLQQKLMFWRQHADSNRDSVMGSMAGTGLDKTGDELLTENLIEKEGNASPMDKKSSKASKKMQLSGQVYDRLT